MPSWCGQIVLLPGEANCRRLRLTAARLAAELRMSKDQPNSQSLVPDRDISPFLLFRQILFTDHIEE